MLREKGNLPSGQPSGRHDERGVTFLGVTEETHGHFPKNREREDVPGDPPGAPGTVKMVRRKPPLPFPWAASRSGDPGLRCGRYLQSHPEGPSAAGVAGGSGPPLPAALSLLLILHRDVQLGDLRGAGRDVDVIGHGPGDGRDYHNDDGDGDHENGGRRQAADPLPSRGALAEWLGRSDWTAER